MDNPLIARLDVRRGQTRAVVEQHVRSQFEGIDLPVGRDLPRLRQIADHLRITGRIEFEKRRIMWRYRMQERERGIAVAIVVPGLDRRGKLQHAAARRHALSAGRLDGENGRSEDGNAGLAQVLNRNPSHCRR